MAFVNDVLIEEVAKHCDVQTLGRLLCVSKSLQIKLDDERKWKQRFETFWNTQITHDNKILEKLKSFRETFISVYLWGTDRMYIVLTARLFMD